MSTGVRLYVTVRVTTSRTLTRLARGFFSRSHDFGEVAEYGEAMDFALAGERTPAGENGDWGMYRRGVRADCGLVNGEGGGIVIIWTLVGGADMGGSSLERSHRLQLLDLEVAGDSLSRGAEVEGNEALEADEVTETGRLLSKTNLELVPVDMGLVSTGERFLRNSR